MFIYSFTFLGFTFNSIDPESTFKLKEDIMPALSSSNLYELRYVFCIFVYSIYLSQIIWYSI